MDGSGGNRYELLFMDDDGGDPLNTLVKKSKTKQAPKQKNAALNNKQQAVNQQNNPTNNKKSTIALGPGAEKENKSSAMNKNVEKKAGGQGPVNSSSTGGGGQQKPKGPASTTTGGQFKDQTNYRNVQDQPRQPREGKTERNVNFKQQNSETREQRNNRRNRDDRPSPQQNGTITPGEFQQNNERPQRRGTTRRNFEGARGGKREFDRQSGSDKTGVKAIDKRDGGGAHNWGSPKQDIEDLNKPPQDEVLTDKDDSAGDQQTEQQPPVNIDEETKELTLDEWKAQRAVRAKPQFNIRKAGEGEDLSQWKKMVALNNKKKGDESEEEFEYDPSMYPQRVGRLQRVLDIEFHFNDGRRGGGAGRGRGRSRGQGAAGGGVGGGRPGRVPRNIEPKEGGGGGGGGGGGDRQQRGGGAGQNAPKVDDEHDFPSLG